MPASWQRWRSLYFRPFVDLVGVWFVDGNVSHSVLLMPVMAYLVWQRRDRLAATERQPTSFGLVVVIVSLAALLLGTAGVEFFLMRTSAIGVIAGSILFLAGWRWLRMLAFPLALTLLVIPIPPVIFYQLTFPLQVMATKFGVAALELVRHPGAARRQRHLARAHDARGHRGVQRHSLAPLAVQRSRCCTATFPSRRLGRAGGHHPVQHSDRHSGRTGSHRRHRPGGALHRTAETATGFFHAFSGLGDVHDVDRDADGGRRGLKLLGTMASAAAARPSLEPSLS